ncbi:DUF86 domain-containing protein [Athalassotoga sp.]|uniref:DUF86 domain-containing protein n=1 Tax=Caldisericum exile TaxID=693075 RepID=A0A2J6X7V1_9BACT|nr:MAG: hypothetical protein C0175_02450 [Caldisericum exile]
MINKDLISERLSMLAEYAKELKAISETDKNHFIDNPILSAAAESYLRRSLECIFDVGRHILAKTGNIELSTEYKAIAKGLGEKEIVDAELSKKMVKMAGYRNRIVHLYNEISNEELYEIITTDLKDIEIFVDEIKSYMNRV